VIRARLAAAARLAGRVLAKSHRDEVGLRASALAFSTLISAVPLLAVVSIFVARTLREDSRIVDLIIELLPYREETVLAALRSFLEQAESVSGVAVLGFVVTSALTFFGVQESLFKIFGVERPPSWFRRIVTFSLLFFWGPLLVGFAQTALLFFSQSSPETALLLRESIVLRALPAVMTFAGLTMLYWRAAFQKISLRDAAAGGLTATALLELLKVAFGFYVSNFTAVQLAVYGTFAIAFFFVLSVHLAWHILLVGAELAAVRAAERAGAPVPVPKPAEPDPWIGLGALELLGAPGRPTMTAEELALALALDEPELTAQLRPLRDAGLLEPGRGYRLALPTRRLRLATVLAAYRRHLAGERDGPLPEHTRELRGRLRRALEFDVGDETLADLLGQAGDLPEEDSDAAPDVPASLARDPGSG
jgi:YihY family inner membrane protein